MLKILALLLCIFAISSRADSGDFSTDLGTSVLSKAVPSAFAPNPWEVEDFKLTVEKPLPGISFKLVSGSLEWVRINSILVLPRALVDISGKDIDAVQVQMLGTVQPLSLSEGDESHQFSVPLFATDKFDIVVNVQKGGKRYRVPIKIQFNPDQDRIRFFGLGHLRQVVFDQSCSNFNLQIVENDLQPTNWMTIGCRRIWHKDNLGASPILEFYVFWEGVPGEIDINGLPAKEVSPGLWMIRIRSKPGNIELKTLNSKVKLSYSLPSRANRAFIGAGIGPYYYSYIGEKISHEITPLLTVYGSFFINDTSRVVFFNATPIHKNWYSDFGVYFHSLSTRFLDERFSLNVLLGGHVLVYEEYNKVQFRWSGPQGLEVVGRDIGPPGFQLSAGLFYYPLIRGTQYYNAWVRYGRGGMFIEANYLAWVEPMSVSDGAKELSNIYTRSFGLTIGLPIAQFL